jgi:hypothetical protein
MAPGCDLVEFDEYWPKRARIKARNFFRKLGCAMTSVKKSIIEFHLG